ncbi:hypothetical protein G5S52_04720 [Grimontia sp. S25]|uniref:Uncharacterized protein n=1 Tax=Grimontia sedimenti TaxID=2711294 RepID=A0A6M1RH67_9GAMM|nr:hypothetical protein [Grimontia sedimenti]NGN96979.1 hypothetical protein [Grimontia sedimenti]
MFEFKTGDWVFTTQSGVWQIYRIELFKAFSPSRKALEDKTLVFAKRFIDDTGKAAFTQEFFSPSSLFPVKGEAEHDLDLYIKSHPKLYAKFLRYKPEPINTVFHCRVETPEHQSTEDIADMFPKDVEFTQSEAVEFVDSLGLKSNSYPLWTVEFVSRGTVLRDGYIRYVFNRVLEF